MLTVIRAQGNPELATVFVGRLADGSCIEWVESIQPPLPRSEKWVLIVSTLKGCPVACAMCDAGERYSGRLSSEEILAQIDHLVRWRYPDGNPTVRRLKVQFARMGDPAFNPAVLEVLRGLPQRYPGVNVMPCISTIAPARCDSFFDSLLSINDDIYRGNFQMQFSLHTTDEKRRRELIPTSTWTFQQMGEYARRFAQPGTRKVTLNFAAPRGFPLDPQALLPYFPTHCCMVKLTPINPTHRALRSGLEGVVDPSSREGLESLVDGFRRAGYDTLVSIGETEENQIGSNCGMFVGEAG